MQAAVFRMISSMTERYVADTVYEQAQRKPDRYGLIFPFARIALNHSFVRMVEGKENIVDQPALYLANHVHFADSPLLAAAYTDYAKKPLRMMAKQEYFEGDGLGDGKLGRVLRWGISRTGQIPVDRDGSNPRAFQTLERRVRSALDHGDSVGLHPEGTRATDGRLHKFKNGAARIAITAEVPIVPVAIEYHAIEDSRKTAALLQFGEPIMPEEYRHGVYGALPRAAKASHFSKVAEDRVAAMLGYDDSRRSGEFARIKSMFTRQKSE